MSESTSYPFYARFHRRHFGGAGGITACFAIAFPMVISSATELAMYMIDRLFLSRLGPAHIAATASGGLMAFMSMTFFFGLLGYTTALVAQYYGSEQRGKCALVVHQGVLIGVLAYPIVLASMPVALWLMHKAGHDPAQQILERQYFLIVTSGALVGFIAAPIRGFFTGIGRTAVVMHASIAAMLVNVAANYVLIFGKFGCPALGIRGAAIGTVLGHVCAAVYIVSRYLGRGNRADYGVVNAMRISGSEIRRLLKFGSPNGAEFFLNIAAFNFFMQLFHGYGQDAAAAMAITMQWDMVSFFPMIGVSMATTSLVGRFMGAKQPDTAEHAAYSGVKIAVFYAGLLGVVFALTPRALVEVFVPAGSEGLYAGVLPLATSMIRLAALYVISDAMAIVFSGALRGAGDTVWCMRVSVVVHWLMALLGYTMIRHLGAPPMTVWSGFVFLVMAMGTIYYLRFRHGKWRTISVLDEPPPASPVADLPETLPKEQ